MTSRREFLRRAAILTAGVVAADQLELVERLGWKRTLFPSFSPVRHSGDLWVVDNTIYFYLNGAICRVVTA